MASVKKKSAKKAPKKATGKSATKPTAVKKSKTALVKKGKPAAKVKKIVKEPKVKKGLPEHLLDAALKILDERLAEDIVSIALKGRSSIADYLIIASGRSSRQVAALADHLREAFTKLGLRQVRVEGKAQGNWVVVDTGDVVIHLFLPEVRKYYDIDSLWKPKRKK